MIGGASLIQDWVMVAIEIQSSVQCVSLPVSAKVVRRSNGRVLVDHRSAGRHFTCEDDCCWWVWGSSSGTYRFDFADN